MVPRALVASFVLLFWGGAVAQPTAPPASATVEARPDRSFRDTSGYRYPALSHTVRDMQNLAYAMQLRDYCADDRVSDEFVKTQLAHFSRITGRTETCRSLLAY